MVPIQERLMVRQDIARLYLLGYGFEAIAGETGLDYDTVRKHAQAWQGDQAAMIKDPEALRAKLLGWLDWTLALSSAAAQQKPSAAWSRAIGSLVQAALDVTGLRSYKIDLGSTQLLGILQAMAQLKAPLGAVPALDAEHQAVIDAEFKVVEVEKDGAST